MSASSSIGTNSNHSSISSSSGVLRRRDKRRQQQTSSSHTGTSSSSASSSSSSTSSTSTTLNLQALLAAGPAEVIALAVRLDESRGDPALLQVPLESGRFYDSHQEFWQALQHLRDQTKPPVVSSASSHSHSKNKKQPQQPQQQRFSSRKTQHPPYALTPIILSGLLSVIREQRSRDNESSAEPHERTSSTRTKVNVAISEEELVLSCQALRRAALARLVRRRRRYRWQRIVLPLGVLGALMMYYVRAAAQVRAAVRELGYCGIAAGGGGTDYDGSSRADTFSCDDMPAYAPACRLAEVWLWWKYHDYLHHAAAAVEQHHHSNNNKDYHLLLEQRYVGAPLALHTVLTQQPAVRLEELNSIQQQQQHELGKSSRASWVVPWHRRGGATGTVPGGWAKPW